MSINERLDKMMERDVRTAAGHSGERGVYIVKATSAKVRCVVSWNESATSLIDQAGDYGHEGPRREADFVIPASVCKEPAIGDQLIFALGKCAGTWTMISIPARDAGATTGHFRLDQVDRANAAGARVTP